MTAKEIERQRMTLEELLDVEYESYKAACGSTRSQHKDANWCSYLGVIKAVERLGYDWKRNADGTHRVFGSPRA